MRIFEMVLIVSNLFPLFFLGFKKQSKIVWLVVAGVNTAVLFIHSIVEGLRYQMAFSYVFVILFIVYTLAKTHKRFVDAKLPKALKVTVISLSLVFLACTSYLAYALPVFTIPKLTGSYDVGMKYFQFVDENRTEPFLYKSTQKRELMVKVYYPAKKDDSKPFSPYFHNSHELIRLFTINHNMPDFMFDHLNLVKTNSKENLQLSEKQQNYPVILFSHGAGDTMEVQTSLSENLASHGYIVVVIDHTYASTGTVFPDRVVSHKDATTDFKTPEPGEIITQIMADDSNYVIRKLDEMNEGKISSIFKRKLNLDKIGAIGHSVGGAVAYNLAINNSRVKAAINLDGRVFITPKKNMKDMAPFLMLASDKFHIQTIQNRKSLLEKFEDMPVEDQKIMVDSYGSEKAYREAYNKAQQNVIGLTEVLKESGNLYTIEGSDHMKFTDIGLFIGDSNLRKLIGIAGKTDPIKCLKITNSLTLSFFDQQLKSDTKDSLESLVKRYSELKKVDLK
ncbi:alpha/beta hydrolase family protein [Shimazuella kribbensis]|uniref:alpha/beta hydrolase family protein n=1 Tax=Shimazuella kribbensis TaxID=139808 RepID=UPI00041424B1|nr:alpha/beta fold hydrolase [Shimazuella kribbensis]